MFVKQIFGQLPATTTTATLERGVEQARLRAPPRRRTQPRLHHGAFCEGDLQPMVRIIPWQQMALLVDWVVVDELGRDRRVQPCRELGQETRLRVSEVLGLVRVIDDVEDAPDSSTTSSPARVAEEARPALRALADDAADQLVRAV